MSIPGREYSFQVAGGIHHLIVSDGAMEPRLNLQHCYTSVVNGVVVVTERRATDSVYHVRPE